MTEEQEVIIDDTTPEEQEDTLTPERLDTITYRLIALGFVLLTLVITTGAVWAQSAWGKWWSWDPKETSALVAWFVYVMYLHGRLVGWAKRTTAWIALVGAFAVLFCYAGINMLPKGASIHQYGAPTGGLKEALASSFLGLEGPEEWLTKAFLFCYLLTFIGYLVGTAFRSMASKKIVLLGVVPSIVGFGFHTAAMALRSIQAGRLPFSSGYEYASCFAWSMVLLLLIMQVRVKSPVVGLWSMPLVALILGYGFLGFENKGVEDLMPALQNMFWLHVHVAIAIISYAAMLLATGTAGLYLWKTRGKRGVEAETDEE